MKKALAVMLAMMMLLATFTTVYAHEMTPLEFYAGVSTITLKYDEPINESSEFGTITLTEQDGTEVTLTPYYNGNILTLKTQEPLEIDGQTYNLVINGQKYMLNLETVWALDVDETGNVTNVKSNVPSDKTAILTSVRKDAVIEDNTAILSGQYAGFSPDYDQTQHENLSMVFDYAHLNSWNVHLGIRFNASTQMGMYRRYPNIIRYSAAFWETSSQTVSRNNSRGIAIYNSNNPENKTIKGIHPTSEDEVISAKYQDVVGITYADLRNLQAGSYSTVYGYTTDNTVSAGIITKGSATINTPNGVSSDLKTYSFAVDKMGTIGTLLIGNELVDVWNTEIDYAEYNSVKEPDLAAPETGYMEVDVDSSAMVIKNWKLVKSKVRQYKKGDLTVEETLLSGDKDKFDIVFNEDVEPAENVNDYIKVTTYGENVEYNYIADGNKLTIIPKGGLLPDVKYDVKISSGFGYEELTVKQEINAEYMFVSRVGDIEIETVKGGDKEIYINFNYDISEIPEAEIKEKLKLELNGNNIPYSLEVNKNTVVMNLGTSIIRDVIYDLKVLKNLGYEKVTVKEDINKYIVMETVINEEFDTGVFSDYISTVRNGDAVDGDKIPKATIRNGKLYVEENDYITVYFNKLGLEKYEDYVIKFDIEHYGKAPQDHIMFNVAKDAAGIMDYGSSLNGFGWNISTSSWVKRMQMGSARGQNVYKITAEPNGGIGGYNADMFTIAELDGEVTLPSSVPVSTSYMIEKFGENAKFYVNENNIDNLDAEKMLEAWNKENSASPITDSIASKGIIAYSSCRTGSGGRGITAGVAFPSVEVSILREYNDGGVKIVENNAGSLTVKNFNNEDSYVKLYVAEYGENNKMLGAKVLANAVLTKGASIKGIHNFDENKIKIIQIDETNINSFKGVKVTEIKKKDFVNNIITVKGTIDKTDYDREIPLFIVKEGTDLEKATVFNEGMIATVPVKAGATEFEYDFEYNDTQNKLYTLEVYGLKGISTKAEYEKLTQYRYAEKGEVLKYIETLKTTKSTMAQLKDYAQSLGSDITFTDGLSENAQSIILESIYEDRNTIGSPESAMKAIAVAKARLVIIQELKNNGFNAVNVDTIIATHASDANLDLSAYNLLGTKKTAVCNSFIKADYESKGWKVFADDFNSKVSSASSPSAGGGGGGGGGGASFVPDVTVTGGKVMTDNTVADTTIPAKTEFLDMEDHAWAKDAVYALKDKGVITGIGGGMFNPEGIVTREQFAKMAVIAFGLYNGDAEADFNDVNKNDWSYTYIASAKKSGLMLGNDENNFMGQNAITREDLCVILYRATVAQGTTYTEKRNKFYDYADVSEYAKEAVEFMVGAGIINGFEDNTFKPKAPATRAQAAQLIYQVMGGNK